MKKNILLIGGSSYFGKIISKKLIKNNLNVYSTYYKNPIRSKYTNELFLDINNYKIEDFTLLPKKIHYLVVLSWINLSDYNSKNHINFSKNLFRLISLISKNYNVQSINVLGSCLEYGIVNGKISENHKCNPTTEYGKSKLYLLNRLKRFQKIYKFKLNWMRIFYIYGDARDRGIWSQFIKAKNENITFNMSKGEQIFDFIHIKKLIELILAVIQSNKNNEIINLCSGKPQKLINLIKVWANKHNVKINPGFYPYTNYEGMSYWGDNKKIKQILKLSK